MATKKRTKKTPKRPKRAKKRGTRGLGSSTTEHTERLHDATDGVRRVLARATTCNDVITAAVYAGEARAHQESRGHHSGKIDPLVHAVRRKAQSLCACAASRPRRKASR